MIPIEWEDPPEPARAPLKWDATANVLRQEPRKWAKVAAGESHDTLSRHIRNATHVSFLPKGSFETKAVAVGDGTFDTYARFLGEAGS